MSSLRPNTDETQPVTSGELPSGRFLRIGKAGLDALHVSERILLAVGLACVMFYVCVRLYATAMDHVGLWSFSQLKGGSPSVEREGRRDPPDFSLWAGKRVTDYKRALAIRIGAPLAVLSIPRLRLEVPVFEGTDELTLDRGAGRIVGTARPGEPGNIGIAAHRDGFFRSLKGIRFGDRIELAQSGQQFTYVVDDISIVGPSDLNVLKARTQPSLTLVTCYPFYFVGEAPKRFIVHASFTNSKMANSETDVEASKLNKEKIQ